MTSVNESNTFKICIETPSGEIIYLAWGFETEEDAKIFLADGGLTVERMFGMIDGE